MSHAVLPTMEKMKAAALVPKKFRSVRDKNGSHRRNKSSEPGVRARPLTADIWLSIFKPESVKQAQREKEEEERETAKVAEVTKRLEEVKYNGVSEELVRYALNSKFADGDVDKTVELLQLQQKAFAGIIQPYNPNVQMLGAENRGNVTCYLDALLFAMFAKLSAFECMLKNDATDEAQRKLGALIRLWVNMLRSGKLIHTDMTEHIQESLAACGWQDAKLIEQQDTSEAFAFITETLQLPLLTLQVDLFHQGKRDVDDHKVVHERLLNLAVPPDPEGKGIKLEDCLEEYFNNKVDVLRDSLEEKMGSEKLSGPDAPTSTIRMITEEDDRTISEHVENPQLQRRWTVHDSMRGSPVPVTSPGSVKTFETPSVSRHRSTSIIQRIVVGDDGKSSDQDNESILQRARRTGSTVVKAVTIPAWQFFRLIPWNAASNNEPKSDIEVARHFNQRPVVGICLKRYTMTEQGVPVRQNTHIDIPDSLRLPHFMVLDDNSEQELDGLSQEYKLVLQSVVCHRGDSLHSGHYIAFARVAPKLLTDNRRHDLDPPPDYEEAQWAKFDDLAIGNRVSYVDEFKEALREEMPYLLFYQIVPMVDVTAVSTDGSVAEPPSYNDSAINIPNGRPGTPPAEGAADQSDDQSKSTTGYFDSATTLVHTGPSIRFSSEIERPSRLSFEDDPSSGHLRVDNSRRGSSAFSESTAVTPSITSDAPSPAVTPQDESTAARLSRAAAKFTKTGSKSRPTSQAGEGRISLTMSRLGFSRSSKDPLNEVNGTEVLDEQAVITEEDDALAGGKAKEHHHFHHQHRKDRTKSKSREKDDKKGKSKENAKEAGVPDRECTVM
ncbi:ubiquitin carboxyl-terminal hydrolase-domain-containing protein [Apodospora peruviana]|uniref:ubiquitinyl hydrolase 1 n=1 Tax=Apodospora peruviana TaxID=516989 RepID=A0AAE0II44_9PEZI|nr:ubiquitin carboxyl-terminal hydrolase-domain-containing protein [Apodospora peruviana]